MPVFPRALLVAAMLAVSSLNARADDAEFQLKPGANLDVVQQNCAACHSLEYVQMNSPFLDEKGWRVEVTKMVKAFGAPIEAADQEKIAQYLTANYGKK